MLSAETLATVKSTAPLLAEQGKAITDLFYAKLFARHPEMKHVFNMANQAQGEQSRALADSIFLYATHIDSLPNLAPMVRRIAHKHASLQVSPEHYPIVGKYLLESIQDHLGLDPQAPVLRAWAEAYQQLADLFIRTEEDIYRDNEQKRGGWRGFRPFVIADIQDEAAEVRSFYLAPEDGNEIAPFQPGQYIGIKVRPPGQEFDEIRQYSLSNAPYKDYYRITVKAERTPQHEGAVSTYLHGAEVGDRIGVQPPTGEFTVKNPERPIVLIGGGVGITPLLSMLLHRLEDQRDASDLIFIHCCRDADRHIMADELRRASAEHSFRYYVSYESGCGADHQGLLDRDVLSEWLVSRNADVYFCGPQPFMRAINGQLLALGFDQAQLHYEVFGPTTRLHAETNSERSDGQ